MAEDIGVMGLVSDLKKLIANKEVIKFVKEVEEDNYVYFSETSDEFKEQASEELKALVDRIVTGLNEHLIADNGSNHQPNRELLYRHGFRFYKGESDEFGPLTAVIGIPNEEMPFRIVYG